MPTSKIVMLPPSPFVHPIGERISIDMTPRGFVNQTSFAEGAISHIALPSLGEMPSSPSLTEVMPIQFVSAWPPQGECSSPEISPNQHPQSNHSIRVGRSIFDIDPANTNVSPPQWPRTARSGVPLTRRDSDSRHRLQFCLLSWCFAGESVMPYR